MSSFVVSKKTLSNVCTAMERHGDVPFARKLLRMNNAAVYARYGKTPSAMPVAFLENWTMPDDSVSCGQLYMSVRCFLYQCSEGRVPNWKLFKLVEKAQVRLAIMLAATHPAVVAADWD